MEKEPLAGEIEGYRRWRQRDRGTPYGASAADETWENSWGAIRRYLGYQQEREGREEVDLRVTAEIGAMVKYLG